MAEWFRRWFGSSSESASGIPTEKRRTVAVPPLVMLTDATLPIVEWEAMHAHAPAGDKPELLDEYWTAVAAEWLNALGGALGKQYAVQESDHFLLLSPQEKARGRAVLEYVERTRKRVLHLLDGIAKEEGYGKVCVLIFGDHDLYYQYVSNYYPPEGEFSLSGGMFLQRGYGHFVFVADQMHVMEPTIAHELTHCMVQHLPLPAWLNEGIAVNTEHRVSPPPSPPLFTPDEMQEKHASFWNQVTIQEFWSGKSWLRPDEANMLSYGLAKHFVAMIARDFETFRAFANAADAGDSGDASALKHLGYPVAHLAEAVLGEGLWQPKPELWRDGVERGQFGSCPASRYEVLREKLHWPGR